MTSATKKISSSTQLERALNQSFVKRAILVLYNSRLLLPLYCIVLIFLTLYSYALVDLNLTLVNNGLWNSFREMVIQIGYFKRDISWILYLMIVISMFIFHFLAIKSSLSPVKLAILIGGITLLAYPFLSHDFFNYMFDAKIATFYHKNPYFFKGLDFPGDQWLRFMHWVHRTYPYGPTFLPITLIPSFISRGKFFVDFILFKSTFFLFYLAGVYFLNKQNRRWAMMFATNPLLIIEGLVNSHNDLLGVSIALVGIYFISKQKGIISRILLVVSAGIKYMTFPLIFLSRSNKKINFLVFLAVVSMLIGLSVKSEIQSWYFLTLLVFITFYEKLISDLWIFFAGLLLSYYPFIRIGGWDTFEKVNTKHWIILISLLLNAAYFILLFVKKNKLPLLLRKDDY